MHENAGHHSPIVCRLGALAISGIDTVIGTDTDSDCQWHRDSERTKVTVVSQPLASVNL